VVLRTALVAQFRLRRPRLVPAMAEVAAVPATEVVAAEAEVGRDRVLIQPRGGVQ